MRAKTHVGLSDVSNVHIAFMFKGLRWWQHVPSKRRKPPTQRRNVTFLKTGILDYTIMSTSKLHSNEKWSHRDIKQKTGRFCISWECIQRFCSRYMRTDGRTCQRSDVLSSYFPYTAGAFISSWMGLYLTAGERASNGRHFSLSQMTSVNSEHLSSSSSSVFTSSTHS